MATKAIWERMDDYREHPAIKRNGNDTTKPHSLTLQRTISRLGVPVYQHDRDKCVGDRIQVDEENQGRIRTT